VAHTLQGKRQEHVYDNRADAREDVMKTVTRTLIASLAWAMPALAAGQVHEEGGSVMIVLFLGFGALILAFQLFPGLAMFAVMLKEILTGTRRKRTVATPDEAAGKL
jgi:hypothetical protein